MCWVPHPALLEGRGEKLASGAEFSVELGKAGVGVGIRAVDQRTPRVNDTPA